MKAAHHRGSYQATRDAVVNRANANPNAICWRDGLTLAQHPPHRTGKPATWTGGHTIDGWADAPAWLNVTRRPPAGAWIAPEASTCNAAAGASRNNALKANPQSRRWLA